MNEYRQGQQIGIILTASSALIGGAINGWNGAMLVVGIVWLTTAVIVAVWLALDGRL